MKRKPFNKLKITILLIIGIKSANAQIITTYTFTGAQQTYTVPAGVTSLTLDVKGAQGGFGFNAPSSPPGSGGRVQAVLAVTPGEVLNIYVGGKGVDGTASVGGAGGFNGGGLGGTWSGGRCGGGGGGASDVRQGGNALGNRVIVASGGGGTGVNFSTGNSGGHGGGLNGVNGLTGTYLGGGATQFAGGVPNGALGVGGPGGVGQTGGGGGGGYYGGGGSAWEGGGGGSSYTAPIGVTSVLHTQGFQTGNGEIVISASSNGAALNFDGTNDIVNCGTAITSSLNGSAGLTAEAWIRPSALPAFANIVSNHNLGGTSFALRSAGTQLNAFVGFGTYTINTAVGTLSTNVWQHVAMVFNGTSIRTFINGVATGSVSFPSYTLPASTNSVVIGNNPYNEAFNGNIDEVRIWNRALCQGEIQNNMMGQLSLPQTSLVAYYQFNQGLASAANPTVTSLTPLAGPTGTLTGPFTLNGASSNWVAPGGVSSTSTVTAFASPTLSIASPTAICSGSSTTLTASGVSSYTWTSGPTTATFAVTPSVTTTYSVVGAATNGCLTNVTTRTINVNTTPTVAINNNTVCGTGPIGALSTTVTGTGPYTYAWNTGATTASISGLTAGAYTSTVTASNGCFSSGSANVISNPVPTVAVNNGTICSGSTFTMVPTGASTYTIQGGSAAVSPTANANYTVVGTSTAGCVSANTATSNVTVNAVPTITVNSGAICSGNSFTITPSGASTYTYSGGSAVVSPTATAAYTVTGTNTVGCNGSAVSNVTVNANPTVNAVSTETNFICVGSSATLTASGASSYVWNTTATTAVIAVSPTTTTSYTVTGTNAAGCSAVAVISQSVSTCTDIKNSSFNSSNLSFLVYPNPSNGIFNVQLESAATIEVTDVLGRVILTDNVNAGTYKLNLGNNVNGVYFVKATVDGKTKTVKIVKD
jgi:hypothetical protein